MNTDENYITLHKADLYDFLRGRIKSILDDYADNGQAKNWATAECKELAIVAWNKVPRG